MNKTLELQKKIEEIKNSNQKKLDEEITKTISDFKSNSIEIKDDSKSGKINFNLTTNKRSLLIGAGALAIASTLSIVAINKIKKHHKQKKIQNKTIITSQIDDNCEN